jgi:Transglycosylase SLT domain
MPDQTQATPLPPSFTPLPPPAPPPGPVSATPLPEPADSRAADWTDIIRTYAKRHRVPPRLALAIAQTESSFNPAAVSPKGAIGLMQLMPETAKRLGVADPTDPIQNVEGGMRELRRLLDENNNDVELTLRRYNGSPQAPLEATDPFVHTVMDRLTQGIAADNPTAAPAAPADPTKRQPRPGDIHVPTAEEVQRATTVAADLNKPPAPAWYDPDQLLQTGKELVGGAAKQAVAGASKLGEQLHRIPGVTSAVDWAYGTPGLSEHAFKSVRDETQLSTPTEKVGAAGEQIGEALAGGSALANASGRVVAKVAPRLAPYVGSAVARLAPRIAVEAPGAAGIAASQGQDPTLAGVIAAGIPVAGALARLPFSSALSPVAQRAVDWARAHGIPVDLATSTANQWVRNIQTAVEQTPLGGAVRAFTERVRGNRLTKAGQGLADQIHPTPVTPAQAGKSVGQALDTRIGRLAQEASIGYDTAESAVGSLPRQQVPTGQINTQTGAAIMTTMQAPVDMGPIRQALRPLLKELEGATIAVQERSPALPALRRIMGGGPFHELLGLEKDLGALKGLADASGGLRNQSQGMAAKGVQVLQDAIDNAAGQMHPDILAGLQKGRRDTALKHLVDDLRTKFQGTAAEVQARGAEPMRGFEMATRSDDVNIEYLKKLAAQVGPTEMRKVGRGFMQDLLETATEEGGYKRAAAMANKWKALGDETKQILYSPQHISDLDNFFRIGRMLAEHPNPSRSALIGISAGTIPFVLKYPIKGSIAYAGSGLIAFLMNNPTGVKLLTQGLTLPGGTPAAAVWAQQVEALLKDEAARKPEKGQDIALPNEPRGATPPPPPPGR